MYCTGAQLEPHAKAGHGLGPLFCTRERVNSLFRALRRDRLPSHQLLIRFETRSTNAATDGAAPTGASH
jgi:hypothetical protein